MLHTNALRRDGFKSHDSYFTLGIEDKELVIGLQQFARVGNVDSCLLLVPCQHPDLDAGFVKGIYRLGDSLLQTVFNASGTYKCTNVQQDYKRLSQLRHIEAITEPCL